VIFNGFKIAVAPARCWGPALAECPRSPSGLLAAALTAVPWPAIAVVGGHLGSVALGFAPPEVAVQRAAVGFVAVVGGALVMAPALALALMRISKSARAPGDAERAGPLAMGLVWPSWAAGLLLAVPPLAGLGPELGEIVWFAVGSALAARALWVHARSGGDVRRRWAAPFFARGLLAFALLFAAVPIAPALAVRAALGVEGELARSEPAPISWPRPEAPDW
jgi:hypothetical protein